MSIRVAILWLVIVGLMAYAWRDWFKALCGLILLMAVIEHPDVPKNVLGIQGLNPWNLLMCGTVLAWLVQRRREGLVWDMPRHVTVLLLLYLGVIVVGVFRMAVDPSHLDHETTGGLISECLINSLKWVVPGLMLFDGCRTRRRLVLGLCCVLGVYFLLAMQVIRWMPPGAALSGVELTARSRKVILNEIGYHPVNMSMILAGASWAVLATLPLLKRNAHRMLVIGVFLAIACGQAMTAGRMGYVTWGIVGLLLCVVRWRRYLLLFPLLPIAVAVAMPGTAERMLQGFGGGQGVVDPGMNDYQVTSGRTLIWPYVIDRIAESPVVGYGRKAMVRTGLSQFLWDEYEEEFPHPHNAYLEMLLDNGVVGFLMVMPFYGLVMLYAVGLFRDSRDPIYVVTGGVACALVLALLVAAMGSQTFYPREGAVGMWCVIGLMLRVYVARSQVGRVISPDAFRRRRWEFRTTTEVLS